MTSSNLILPTDTFIFDLFYGEPGSGKSDAIKHMLIQALKENPGKKVKLVVGDGSVATYNSLVASGKAEMCLFMQRPWPMDVYGGSRIPRILLPP
jgi:RecA/RadA recombinase